MALNQNPLFPAEKLAAMRAAHDEYNRLKSELLQPVIKQTIGKMNTLDTASAAQWLAFGRDNPTKITDRVNPEKFANALDADALLVIIEKMESEDQSLTRVHRYNASSDIRFYWTNTEDFYIDAAADDAIIKAKYKDLPSISPKRQTDAEIQSAFNKLEAKRNKKKNGDLAAPTP